MSCSGMCTESKTKTRKRFERVCSDMGISPGYPYNHETNRYSGHLVKQSHWECWQHAVNYEKLKD